MRCGLSGIARNGRVPCSVTSENQSLTNSDAPSRLQCRLPRTAFPHMVHRRHRASNNSSGIQGNSNSAARSEFRDKRGRFSRSYEWQRSQPHSRFPLARRSSSAPVMSQTRLCSSAKTPPQLNHRSLSLAEKAGRLVWQSGSLPMITLGDVVSQTRRGLKLSGSKGLAQSAR